ncbi:MAG: hypothetical protein HYW01_03650 [Deltaproteobacteria bacterium]|nr:hypothetical protein [Deltaproteobacteria bacterium]
MRKLILILVTTSLSVIGGVLAIMAEVGYYTPPTPSWFTGSTEDKVEKIGLIQPSYADLMLWTGIRLDELYASGMSGKSEYAKHQAIKIRETLEKAALVDPTRRSAIEGLLSANYPGLIEAIDSKNPDQFKAAFGKLYASCVTCHVNNGIPFYPLIPTTSISPITSGSLEFLEEIQKHLRQEQEKKLQQEQKKK